MIEFKGVTRIYRRFPSRQTTAIADFTLSVLAGEVVGIAGPNGAGKTTLISLLLGFLRPTEGEILVRGLSPRGYIERNGVGYLPELVAINREWKVKDALARFAALGGMSRATATARVGEVLAELGLEEYQHKLMRELSKGTIQRVGIAQAILQRHDLMIFDEPTHGLDPVWSYGFRDLIVSYRAAGRVIFIASHNLDELERLADRVIIIDKGRLQNIVDLRTDARVPAAYRIELAAGGELVATVFPGAVSLNETAFRLPAMDLVTLNAGLGRLLAMGAQVVEVGPVRSRLEQQFMTAVNQ